MFIDFLKCRFGIRKAQTAKVIEFKTRQVATAPDY